METPQHSEYQTDAPRSRRWLGRIFKTLLLLFLIGLGLLSYQVISSGTSPQEVLIQLGRLITSRDRELKGETDGRTNILLVGIGGSGHDGPYLTDSMLLVSLRPQTKEVSFISIPRDLLVEIPRFGRRRINNAYALTEINSPGQGGTVASTVVSQTFGVPIHYYLRLDFSGFAKLVDTLGGITIDVQQPLDDEFYPIPGKEKAPETERYEHLVIPAGVQRFNGERALKYVRSRKAKGAQGSDFARSVRQQQVIAAIRDETLSQGFLRPNRLGQLVQIVRTHLDTNLQLWEMIRFYQIAQDIDPQRIIHHVLDDRPGGLLEATIYDGAYVLVPRLENFSALQSLAADPFSPITITQPLKEPVGVLPTSTTVTVPIPLPSPVAAPRVQIHNGTTITGLAARTERYLRDRGHVVIGVGNAPIQTYLKTVIYNLRPPAHNDTLRDLSRLLEAIPFESGVPAPVMRQGRPIPYPVHPDADLLIILGDNAKNIVPE